MAQTPCIKRACGESIDYTPSGDKLAGLVIVLGSRLVGIAPLDIADGELGAVDLDGLWEVPKVTGSITVGSALYWDDDADPLNGTAGSGAFTTNSALGPFAGWAAEASSGNTILMKLASQDSATTTLRDDLGQDDLAPYPIANESWQIWDSTTRVLLGATATSADDLIFTLGTIGTAASKLTGTDFGGSNATQKARIQFSLPPEYVAGESITIRIAGFTGTTVADTSSTVDLSVYRLAAPTVDICATAATSINALTVANKDFTITPTDCVPGDILDILLTYAGVDGGNLGVIVPTINQVTVLLDIKG